MRAQDTVSWSDYVVAARILPSSLDIAPEVSRIEFDTLSTGRRPAGEQSLVRIVFFDGRGMAGLELDSVRAYYRVRHEDLADVFAAFRPVAFERVFDPLFKQRYAFEQCYRIILPDPDCADMVEQLRTVAGVADANCEVGSDEMDIPMDGPPPKLVGTLDSLNAQVRYPPAAVGTGVEGRVMVQFRVEPEGTVGEVHVVRGLGHGFDEEAVRVMRQAKFVWPEQASRRAMRMAVPISFRAPEPNQQQ